jgi:hypothetical protein
VASLPRRASRQEVRRCNDFPEALRIQDRPSFVGVWVEIAGTDVTTWRLFGLGLAARLADARIVAHAARTPRGKFAPAADIEDRGGRGSGKAPAPRGCGKERTGRCNFARKDRGPSAKRYRWMGDVLGAAAQVLAETGEPFGRVSGLRVNSFPFFMAHGPTLCPVFR